MERIYLDHNATTRPAAEVVAAVRGALEDGWGNPSSMHWFGQSARKAEEEAREKVAAFLGADPAGVIFVSGGTEANYLAIRGAALARTGQKGRIITSGIEHPSVSGACRSLESLGFEIVTVPVDREGRVAPEAVAAALNEETVLVSIMTANNETGAIQPISEIGRLVKARGALMHTDAVQAAGKIKIEAADWPVDLLSISGHKFYGPKGVGALYIRKGVQLAPQQRGGGQEGGIRGGTENMPGIIGLGAAAALAAGQLETWSRRISRLRDLLESQLLRRVPHTIVNGDREHRVPNTSNLSFPGAEGEAVLISLDLKGVAVSTGSACSSGGTEPSHVILAMGVPPEEARCSIRFSLGKDNTEAEIMAAAEAVVESVKRIREIAGVKT